MVLLTDWEWAGEVVLFGLIVVPVLLGLMYPSSIAVFIISGTFFKPITFYTALFSIFLYENPKLIDKSTVVEGEQLVVAELSV